jgi:integrase
MKILLWQRLARNTSGTTTRDPAITYRFRHGGHVITRTTAFTPENCGGLRGAMRAARAKAQAHIRALEMGAVDLVDAEFRRRADAASIEWPTVGALLIAHERLSAGHIRPNTAHSYRLQLLNVLRTAGHAEPASVTLDTIGAHTAGAYLRAVLAAAQGENATGRRLAQMKRSADSTLLAARCLFNPVMRRAYAEAGVAIPPSVAEFCAAPDFCSATKREYQEPPDHIIAATFKSLDEQRTQNPNLYVAVWLALGFGLRKSEISGVQVRDFQTFNGQLCLVLREVWVARRRYDVTKNADELPRVPVSNGAWEHLAPFLAGRLPGDYLLSGVHKSARMEYTFRAVSEWMRGLGWGTQKTVHEFRAFAGCQVARRDGIEAASKWLRHSSIVVTQQSYGRYLKPRITDAPLELPTVTPGTFAGTVLPSAAAVTKPVSGDSATA